LLQDNVGSAETKRHRARLARRVLAQKLVALEAAEGEVRAVAVLRDGAAQQRKRCVC